MNIDKDALRKAAEAATPGPWFVEDIKNEGIYGDGPDARSGFRSQAVCDEKEGNTLFDTLNSDAGSVDEDDDGAWDEVGARNATYIAAANPATVIALLDEIAALAADREALELDAKRYRWLRAQHWSDGRICVVSPSAVSIGCMTQAGESLDSTIDAALAAAGAA